MENTPFLFLSFPFLSFIRIHGDSPLPPSPVIDGELFVFFLEYMGILKELPRGPLGDFKTMFTGFEGEGGLCFGVTFYFY